MGSASSQPSASATNGTKSPEVSALTLISRKQLGVFTRQQVIEVGLSDAWLGQRVKRGDFIRLHRGVFALRLAPRVWERDAIAACLAGPPMTVLSHRSAARALGLNLALRENEVLDVTIPYGTAMTLHGGRVHLARSLHRADRARVGRLSVTNVARTLIDLAGTLTDTALRTALDDVLTRRRTSPALVAAAIARNRCGRRPGSDILESALAPWLAGRLESPAEAEMLRLLNDRGLPAPTTQVREVLEGGITFRLDFAWVAQRVALEVDGFQYHDGPERFIADRHRTNLLAGAGWHVLRTTTAEMRSDPEGLCWALRRVLGDRSG